MGQSMSQMMPLSLPIPTAHLCCHMHWSQIHDAGKTLGRLAGWQAMCLRQNSRSISLGEMTLNKSAPGCLVGKWEGRGGGLVVVEAQPPGVCVWEDGPQSVDIRLYI